MRGRFGHGSWRVGCAIAVLAVVTAASGCLTPHPNHALKYVVLPNHDDGRPSPPSVTTLELEARAAKDEAHYPIYGDAPPPAKLGEGMGGSGCSVGLIGTQCERGLLSDEAPLDQEQLLGPDGKVFPDDRPFRLYDDGPARPGGPAAPAARRTTAHADGSPRRTR